MGRSEEFCGPLGLPATRLFTHPALPCEFLPIVHVEKDPVLGISFIRRRDCPSGGARVGRARGVGAEPPVHG